MINKYKLMIIVNYLVLIVNIGLNIDDIIIKYISIL